MPLLGDIPLLGWFFRYTKSDVIKTNLMVFLQPTILKDAAIIASYTGDKYNYIRAKQLELREEGLRLASKEQSPLLAENKQFLTLPLPYNETVTKEDGEQSSVTAEPPTMMEQVNDKQSKPTDGGNQ